MRHKFKSNFLEFLNGKMNIQNLESWIYSTKELESELEKDTFLELIEFNFKDKYAEGLLVELILSKIIKEEEFLEFKIKHLLNQFIEFPKKTKELLDEFYMLSTDAYNSNGEVESGFKFLQNLGLNYLFWMDEGYLKTNYGKKWQIEYKKFKDELPFYNKQLLPIARKILLAIDTKQIEIKGQGIYTIESNLKEELESKTIIKLEHKATNTV